MTFEQYWLKTMAITALAILGLGLLILLTSLYQLVGAIVLALIAFLSFTYIYAKVEYYR